MIGPSAMSSVVSTSQGIHLPVSTTSVESNRPMASSAALGHPEIYSTEANEPELLSVSWNQNCGCFAAGTSSGFRIYNCEPFSKAFRRNMPRGIGIVEMLFRSNCYALVGGGDDPQYPPNKVIIWDDHLGRSVHVLTLRSDVLAVKLKQDRIVVVLKYSILIYSFTNLKLIHEIDTSANPRGLCCLSHNLEYSVLICPGMRRGQIRIEHFGLKTIMFISAHDSDIACLALTLDGLRLATASTKGTLIRIFNTKDGSCLQEVRRGIDRADIYSLAFSPNMQWLSVSSDKGTIHVFALRVQEVGEDASRRHASVEGPQMVHQNFSASQDLVVTPKGGASRSSLSFMKGVLPKYFSSERSFAQFYLPGTARYIAAFGAQNTIAIVGMDGSFYRCSFDPVNGGEMALTEHIRFLKC